MLIEINLLPEHQYAKKEKTEKSFLLQKILPKLFIAAVILIVLNILFFVSATILKINIKMSDNKLQHFKPDIEKMQKLESQLKQSQDKVQTIKRLIDERMLWAKRTMILAEVVPKGIWLSSLHINETNITIEGNCVSLKGEEMNLISGFITVIKSNKDFFTGFKQLELGPVHRRVIGNIEVVNFMFFGDLDEKH